MHLMPPLHKLLHILCFSQWQYSVLQPEHGCIFECPEAIEEVAEGSKGPLDIVVPDPEWDD